MNIKLFFTAVIAFFVFSTGLPSAFAQEDSSNLLARIQPSVVKVIVFDDSNKLISSGSAFYVASDKVVTNKHVVDGFETIYIQTDDNRRIRVTFVSIDRASDLALLTLQMPNASITPFRLAGVRPRVGEKIFVVGSPLGLSGSVSDGIVSAFRDLDSDGIMLQITAPISPGSSGSPVVNSSGQVVGVATLYLKGGQNLNFAIPAERISAAWASLASSTNGVSTRTDKSSSVSRPNMSGRWVEQKSFEEKTIVDSGDRLIWENRYEAKIDLEAVWTDNVAYGFHNLWGYLYVFKIYDENTIMVWAKDAKVTDSKEKTSENVAKMLAKKPQYIWVRVRQ